MLGLRSSMTVSAFMLFVTGSVASGMLFRSLDNLSGMTASSSSGSVCLSQADEELSSARLADVRSGVSCKRSPRLSSTASSM